MNDKNAPADPLTPAAEGWATLHEMYTGMREAGFSMLEAAAIIAAMVKASDEPKPGDGG